MTEVLDSAIASVESLEGKGAGETVVTVRVKGVGRVPGVGDVPNAVAGIRARARALAAAGVVPSTIESIRDIPAGELQRLTKVISVRNKGTGDLVVDKVYKIRVSS